MSVPMGLITVQPDIMYLPVHFKFSLKIKKENIA